MAARRAMLGRARGFTVLEAMMAMFVIAGIILALFSVISVSFKDVNRDSQRVQAVSVGQQYLDLMRQYVQSNGSVAGMPAPPVVAIDAGDTMSGTGAANASPGNFNVTGSCPLAGGSTFRFDCTVTVTWTQDGAARSVQVESYVTSQK